MFRFLGAVICCLGLVTNLRAEAQSDRQSAATLHQPSTHLIQLPGQQSGSAGQEYLSYATVTVRPLTTDQDKNAPTGELTSPAGGQDSLPIMSSFSPKIISDYLDLFSSILVFGEKVWKIIENNAAVLNFQGRPISVLPHVPDVLGQKVTPLDLENWQLPKAQEIHYVGYSNFGNVLADMTYTVHFYYGGTYEGQGSYLTGINIVPTKIYVKWGNDFEVKSELKAVANLGDKLDPVMAASLEVQYLLKTPFSTRMMADMITVTGDGRVLLPQRMDSSEN